MMKHFKVIDQLQLIDGELMCKKMNGRSYQKAHYKQGDLDGACGAYSIAMVLNILGVLDAGDVFDDSKIDKRTTYGRLIKTLNKEYGLYPDGLTANDIKKLLLSDYSQYVDVECKTRSDKDALIGKAVKCVNENTPVILSIRYINGQGHWIVVIGYVLDENENVTALLTLDPGNDSPTYALWNGVLSLEKERRKKYGYCYTTDLATLVDFDAEVIITCI